MRTIIFGAGTDCARLLERGLPGEEVIGLINNDAARHGTVRYGIPVVGMSALESLILDRILIASSETAAVRQQLLGRGIAEDRRSRRDAESSIPPAVVPWKFSRWSNLTPSFRRRVPRNDRDGLRRRGHRLSDGIGAE